MADFSDVVNELEKANKLNEQSNDLNQQTLNVISEEPSDSTGLEELQKSNEVLGKQTLNALSGLGEESGAAAVEEKRDEQRNAKYQTTLLERIAKAVSSPANALKDAKPETKAGVAVGGGGLLCSLASTIMGGAKTGLAGLMKGAVKAFSSPKMAKVMGPAAIAAGIALMVKDGIAGMKMADEWGTSKTSAAMGGILGGVDSGFKGAMKNMGKWALIGAGIGSFFPVVGTLIGGLIGAVIGAIL